MLRLRMVSHQIKKNSQNGTKFIENWSNLLHNKICIPHFACKFSNRLGTISQWMSCVCVCVCLGRSIKIEQNEENEKWNRMKRRRGKVIGRNHKNSLKWHELGQCKQCFLKHSRYECYSYQNIANKKERLVRQCVIIQMYQSYDHLCTISFNCLLSLCRIFFFIQFSAYF